MADIVERLHRDKWHVTAVDCQEAADEIITLRTERDQLRQYLDAAQRRGEELRAQVAALEVDAGRWRTLVANSSHLDYPANDMGALISPPFRRWYHDSVYEAATFADAIDAARKGEA